MDCRGAVVAHARIFVSRQDAEREAAVLTVFASGRHEVRQRTKAVVVRERVLRDRRRLASGR
jgi:hypothetical protein